MQLRSLVIALVTVGAPVALLPAKAGADGTMSLRVTDAGFDWIAQEVASRVPETVEISNRQIRLLECWPADSTATFGDAHVTLENFELSMPMIDDELSVELRTDVHLTGTAALDAIGCAFLSATCDLQVDVESMAVHAAVEIEDEPGVGPVVHVSALEVDVVPANLSITLDDCTGGLDGQANTFIEGSEAAIVQFLHDGLADWADGYVQPLLDEVLARTLVVPIDAADWDATMRLRELRLEGDALEVTNDLGLHAREIDACVADLPASELEADPGVQFARWDPTPFALGISERVLDEALVAVWQSGRLCQEPREVRGLGGILPGIPEGVDMTLQVTVGASPDAHVTPEGISVDLRDLEIGVDTEDEAGNHEHARFEGNIHAQATFEFDPETNGLLLQLEELDLTELVLVEGALPEGLDVAQFMSDVVLPLGLERYRSIRVLDGVIGLSSYWVIVNAIDYFDRSMSIAFELFHAPDGDTGVPDTIVVERPDDTVTPGRQRIVVSGTDDLVPERLLRYRMRDEGGEWSEPTFSPIFDVEAGEAGVRSIHVQAMDLAGNVDPDPAKISFTVATPAPQSHPEALPPPEETDDDVTTSAPEQGGCSCRTAGSRSAPPMSIAMLALALALVILRRQR